MNLPKSRIDAWRGRFRGEILTSGDAAYDQARRVWNAMIERHPSLIVRPVDVQDVRSAVRFAVDEGLPISIRGGGHNIAGLAVCDDGLVIDLSEMREVEVDRHARVVDVQGGAQLGDMDSAAQRQGLIVPGGVVSTTGVAGLTLGGGFGWLSRGMGLAADNLLAAQVVAASGEILTVDQDNHPDLLWALRGGGGNFGVVTRFRFRAHELRGPVLFGPTVYRMQDARAVLRHYGQFCAQAPRECCVWADLCTAGPLPFLPTEYHGTRVLVLMQCYHGTCDEGTRVLAPLRGFGHPIGDGVAPTPFTQAQSRLDETYAHGARNYWGSQSYARLDDELIERMVAVAESLPTDESDLLISQLGGAIDDVAADAAAYPHRGMGFMASVGARWRDPASDDAHIAWARQATASLRKGASGAAYVNFEAETAASAPRVYGASLPLLATIKGRFDPGNVFRVNHNVDPKS
ncbi:MAG: FAD-binding oxidoreductase [Gammaproteobacteria bacterium]|nr:FAD-binding oxidoreductase [Gammaproteobacteria bacterium]